MNIEVNLHHQFYKIFLFDFVTSWPQVTWRDLYTREVFFLPFSLEKVTFACFLYMVKFWEIGYFYKYFIFIFLVEGFIGFFFRPGEQLGLGDEPLVDVEPRNWKEHIGHHERLTTTGSNSSGQLVQGWRSLKFSGGVQAGLDVYRLFWRGAFSILNYYNLQ